MRDHWPALFLLPLGILIGYLLPHPADRAAPPSPSPAATSGPSRTRPPERDTLSASRIRALVETIATRDRSNPPPVVPITDIPAVIAQLLSQAGPYGLPWELKSAIDKMLTQWAKEDFNGALAWATAYPNLNAASNFLQTILKVHAKEDFDNTLAILATLRDTPGLHVEVGSELFGLGVKRGAGQAFEILDASISYDGGSSGSTADFPADFDFAIFAKLISDRIEQAKSENKQVGFDFFPSNLLDEWAKRDPTAALEFYLGDTDLPFNDLGNITNTFLNISDPSSTYPWLGEQYQNLEGKQRSKFVEGLTSVYPWEMGSQPLIGLANSLPTPALRERMATEMLAGFGSRGRNGQMPYLDLLIIIPPRKSASQPSHKIISSMASPPRPIKNSPNSESPAHRSRT